MLEFKVQGLGFGVGFRVQGLGLRVQNILSYELRV